MRLPTIRLTVLAVALLPVALSAAQPPPRALSEAMRSIFNLRDYTVFDWISGRYLKGTLTLQGWVRTPQLKEEAAKVARGTAGVDEVVNEIEVLPALSTDDDVRLRAYVAVYSSAGLEQYGPGRQFSGSAVADLIDSARFGIDASGVGRGPHAIHIVVNGARLLLVGQVRTTGDRRIAEASLRSLPGVLGVTNQLRVGGQNETAALTAPIAPAAPAHFAV
jgi:osmotically-inducible protein OsmY